MATKLTLKRENFAIEVTKSDSQVSAYKKVYNCERMSEKTIAEAASRLMKDSKILAKIAELKKPVIEKTQLTLERVIIENMNVAFFDIRTILDEQGNLLPISEWPAAAGAAISSIEILEQYEGSGKERQFVGYLKKVKLVEKGAALDRLMKHLGAYEKDNKQKENNPMLMFMQQIMGSALPIAKNPHIVDVQAVEDDE